jgi:hypothetical protein
LAAQTNQRVEHKQFGFEAGDRGVKRPLLLGMIEPKGRHGDDMDVETVEVGGGGDALEALWHDVRGILGGEQQDGGHIAGSRSGASRGCWKPPRRQDPVRGRIRPSGCIEPQGICLVR